MVSPRLFRRPCIRRAKWHGVSRARRFEWWWPAVAAWQAAGSRRALLNPNRPGAVQPGSIGAGSPGYAPAMPQQHTGAPAVPGGDRSAAAIHAGLAAAAPAITPPQSPYPAHLAFKRPAHLVRCQRAHRPCRSQWPTGLGPAQQAAMHGARVSRVRTRLALCSRPPKIVRSARLRSVPCSVT